MHSWLNAFLDTDILYSFWLLFKLFPLSPCFPIHYWLSHGKDRYIIRIYSSSTHPVCKQWQWGIDSESASLALVTLTPFALSALSSFLITTIYFFTRAHSLAPLTLPKAADLWSNDFFLIDNLLHLRLAIADQLYKYCILIAYKFFKYFCSHLCLSSLFPYFLL